MKTPKIATRLAVSTAALSLAALVGGSAIAQQATQTSLPTPARYAPADADRDGRVSEAEFVQGRVDRLVVIDADHDGVVSPEERRAGRLAYREARQGQRMEARFDRLDADKNGEVSRAEFGAAATTRSSERAGRSGEQARGLNQAGPGRWSGEARQSRWGGHSERAHWNHPGVGWGRRRGAQRIGQGPIVIAEAQSRLTAAFARVDTDHDGYVTPQERRAGRQAMRDQRRQSQPTASPSAPVSE